MTKDNRQWPEDECPLDLLMQRCVDGELDAESERGLLARLDFQPAGWRRLALMFVEERLLQQVCRDTARIPPSDLAPRARSRPGARMGAGWKIAILSAAVLLAFWIGRRSSPTVVAIRPEPSVAQDRPGTSEAEPPRRIAQDQRRDSGWPRPATINRETAPQPAMFVRWNLSAFEEPIDVPVYGIPEDATAWQPFDKPLFSREELNVMRRAGYHVESRRELMQLVTPEGREVVLPLESVGVEVARY